MMVIPSYEKVAIGNFWKACKFCKFSEGEGRDLYCRRGSFPKKLRNDRKVNPDGYCGYYKDADIPF